MANAMQVIALSERELVATCVRVHVGDVAAGASDAVLRTSGLGSCVGVALYDETARIGALAHVLLPNVHLSAATSLPGKYACTAVPAMIARMRALGSCGPLTARLIGGASMFAQLLPPRSMSIGARNVAAAHVACTAAQIEIVAEDTGGAHGRSVLFDVASGIVRVSSVLREDVYL